VSSSFIHHYSLETLETEKIRTF